MNQTDSIPFDNSRNLLFGLLLGVVAYTIIPTGDGLAKVLASEGYSSVQATWGRYLFHFMFLAPIVFYKYGSKGFFPKGIKSQTIRVALIIIATFLFFTSLQTVPLADALALAFVAPLVVTGLSVIFLKEEIGFHRWLAVFAGFIGALIIIKPGTGLFQWTALYALAGGSLFGIYITMTKKAAGQNPPLISLLYMGMLGTASLSLLVGLDWIQPDLKGWLLMAGIGACAAIGHGLIITATNYMEASLIAPMQYIELLVGAVFGFVIFGDIPDQYTWIGSIIIILSGLYIGYRERLKSKHTG